MTPADDAAFAELSRQSARGAGLVLEAYKDKCVRRRIAVRGSSDTDSESGPAAATVSASTLR